jgi:HSP20 family protein
MVEEKKKKKEEGLDIDFGIGKLSLGGLFKGIEKLIDLAAELKEAGGEIKKEGEIDLTRLKEGMKGVYGFSIKTAVGGKPIVETFGNIKKTPEGPIVEEEREPLTDVFDEKDEIVVIAEIPGISEEGITLDLKEDILEISAAGKNRKYYKEVLLPVQVKKETLSYTYKNGILEVRIKK